MSSSPAVPAEIVVSCDFDDTILLNNATEAVYRRYSRDWEPIVQAYQAGLISVEEQNFRLFRTVRAAQNEVEQFVRRHARVRPGFAEFARCCRALGAPLVVNSVGPDVCVVTVLRDLGLEDLPVACARAEFTDDGVLLSYTAPDGTPVTEGTKAATVRHLKAGGARVIHIGDGRSDEAAALEADFVFARGSLLAFCRSRGLPHAPFEDFFEITGRMKDLGSLLEGDERRGREGAADL